MASSVAVLGSTGLVGSYILQFLLKVPTPSTITTITRRDIDPQIVASAGSHKLNSVVEKDSNKWAEIFSADAASSKPSIMFSALGTTKAAAGSFEKQYVIDHDVNVAVAKAAKEAGVRTFVMISSGSASADSRIAYSKMKGETDRDVEALGFDKVVIVRPGLILGSRTESRPLEAAVQGFAGLLGKVSTSLTTGWAQPAEVIARAAIKAGLESGTGTVILNQADIVRLGSKED